MDAEKQHIIDETANFVKTRLTGEGSGHDWWHIYRVWRNAITISQKQKADTFVVQLGALLHDIADWKLHDGDEEIGPRLAQEWMESCGVDAETISHVREIIKDVSFKGEGETNKISTIEGMIVQDADRLDAIGAIGVGRTFTYGGYKGREIYNPDIPPLINATADQYKNHPSPTINHFYEKLLHLKNLMNTETGKRIAEKRHEFMELFLKTFLAEWDGKDTTS